jgi:hypothetical protein
MQLMVAAETPINMTRIRALDIQCKDYLRIMSLERAKSGVCSLLCVTSYEIFLRTFSHTCPGNINRSSKIMIGVNMFQKT